MVVANKSTWVLVETVDMFRMRYVVECPLDHPEYALDTVTEGKAKEFSQNHIGETISSYRVISEEEALALCDVDNIYQSAWTKAEKIKGSFTRMEDLT